MPCDTSFLPGQTISQRAEEIRAAVKALDLLLTTKKVKVVISKQGAIAFQGWDTGRNRITDACAYRRIMATGSALAKMEIARAEQMSGVSLNKQVIGQGVHSHDGGKTWHNGH